MGSRTDRILNSIQKLGCDCSEVCKTCVHLSVPASKEPCKGCKYGSLGGKKDNYAKKKDYGRGHLIRKSKEKSDKPETPTDAEETNKSYGGLGNVGNTPPSVGEKRAWDKEAFIKALLEMQNGRE